MKTEYITLKVQVKITYDKGYKKEAIEKAQEACVGAAIYSPRYSAETMMIID